MKFLVDFFPILLFFVAYKMYGIYAATVAAIVASFVQVGLFWLKHRRFETTHLLTLALIVVFGGATLLLQNELFIKWKPSVLNWLLGAVFLGSQFIGKQNVTQRMLSKNIALPSSGWIRLNLSWATFFIVLGFVNLYVVYNYDTDTWVNFKLFGILGLTFLFVIAQAVYLSRYGKSVNNADQEH